MPPITSDLLGRNPDKRIEIILLYAAHPEGLAVVDAVYELGYNKRRTGLVNNHLDPLVEAGVLKECPVVPKHSKQKRETGKNGYRMTDKIPTLKTLANKDELCDKILESAYYVTMVDPVCEYLNDNLSAAGMPKLTETEKKCLKLVVKRSKSCLFFVLNGNPSELKTMKKEIEDRNDRQKETITHLVGAMIDDPGAIAGLLRSVMVDFRFDQHGIATMNKTKRRELKDLAINMMDMLVISPPSWQMFFFDMMKMDQAICGTKWSTEDENIVIELVMGSLGSPSPEGA
jgi:hypothetical protein